MHADRKSETGEMCMKGRARGTLDLNHYFFLVQPDKGANGGVVLPCGNKETIRANTRPKCGEFTHRYQ